MNLRKSLLKFRQKKKQDKFWRNPDRHLAAVILTKEGEQVYGSIKDDLALLERVPKPETGYFYKDVVHVKGPTGTQILRDDEIEEYEVVGLHLSSGISTFTFAAVILDSSDYFQFLEYFKGHGHKVEFPWSSEDHDKNWKKGYCTADNLDQAKGILSGFAGLKEGRKVKDIKEWTRVSK